MNRKQTNEGDESSDVVASLVLTLHETERRLQKLVAKKVQVDPDGDTSWQAGILNALPANIALLDGQGYIISVNDGWRQFAQTNELPTVRFGVGSNYLDTCDRAHGADCVEAVPVAEGIRAVLAGRTRKFSLEYPCHSATQQRWFLLEVTPLAANGGEGVVVMHMNISERRRAQAESRRLADRLTATLDSMSDAFFTLDGDWRFTFLNQHAELLLGRGREALLGRSIWEEFPSARGSVFEREYRRAVADNVTVAFEEYFKLLDFCFSVRAYPSEHGLAVYFRDITESRRAAEGLRSSEIRVRRLNRVYAVLSQINALIVRKPSRDALFQGACRIAVDLGEFRFAWCGLVDRNADLLTPVASAGDVDDFFQCAPRQVFECQAGTSSRAAQALHEREPQVVNEFGSADQVLLRQDMESRGIRSFAIIPLVIHGEAVGVFALYAQEAGFFDAEEVRLLQELAGNMALTLENIEQQERLDFLAYYDPLTGLANRSLFLDRVSQHMRSAAGSEDEMTLMLFDLERFKNINDSLGREAGDALLQQVSNWVARRAGDAGLLARVGPNQFAAVMPRVRPDGNLSRFTTEGLALVSTIITLAHSLQHTVIAEGVETEEQVGLLRSLACDEMQGFHFGRPVPCARFEQLYLAPGSAPGPGHGVAHVSG